LPVGGNSVSGLTRSPKLAAALKPGAIAIKALFMAVQTHPMGARVSAKPLAALFIDITKLNADGLFL
jgi:hypothetical protein